MPQDELNDVELMRTGRPLAFEVAGRSFQLRQPEPWEYDRIRAVELQAFHAELESPLLAGLKDKPVSKDAQATRMTHKAALELAIEETDDPVRLRELEAQLAIVNRPDERSRAEELAEICARRTRDRWIWEHCLLNDEGKPLSDEEWQEINAFPMIFEEARPHIWRIVAMMVTVPKWD